LLCVVSAHSWSTSENLIRLRRPPRKHQCESVLMTEPVLAGRSGLSVKDRIASKIRYAKIRDYCNIDDD